MKWNMGFENGRPSKNFHESPGEARKGANISLMAPPPRAAPMAATRARHWPRGDAAKKRAEEKQWHSLARPVLEPAQCG